MTIWHPLTCACCMKLEKRNDAMYCVESIARCQMHDKPDLQEWFKEVREHQAVVNAIRAAESLE